MASLSLYDLAHNKRQITAHTNHDSDHWCLQGVCSKYIIHETHKTLAIFCSGYTIWYQLIDLYFSWMYREHYMYVYCVCNFVLCISQYPPIMVELIRRLILTDWHSGIALRCQWYDQINHISFCIRRDMHYKMEWCVMCTITPQFANKRWKLGGPGQSFILHLWWCLSLSFPLKVDLISEDR